MVLLYLKRVPASDDLVLEAWLPIYVQRNGDFIELETETDTGYLIVSKHWLCSS